MNRMPVVIFGAGGVGRALFRQLVTTREIVASRNRCHFDIVAVLDSSSWAWQPDGLTDEQLEEIIKQKEDGHSLGSDRPENQKIFDHLSEAGLVGGLLVDVTAADNMEPIIDEALESQHGVVLANKKPLTGLWEHTRGYYNHPCLRYESTVGGGQPVINTLRYLRDTGDPVINIEGQLSGTLGYICSQLDKDTPFSVALAEAKARGFTEPDPREDLGGRDVMRKIMILGRLAGWPLEETDIEVESLYHPALSHLAVDEFMNAAVAMDPSLMDRVQSAKEAGQVLRYVAQVDDSGGSVGLTGIPIGSPLADLKYISFRTGRYEDEPLMIGGKGAGVEMTAAGVLGDMISLSREML